MFKTLYRWFWPSAEWRAVRELLESERRERTEIMDAIKTLNENLAALTATIDRAVTALTTPPVGEVEVQKAADSVKAQNDRLAAALTPLGPVEARPAGRAPQHSPRG